MQEVDIRISFPKDLCLFIIVKEYNKTIITFHQCYNKNGESVHDTIHGFKIYDYEPCINFETEINARMQE